MPSRVGNEATLKFMQGDLNLREAGDDIRMMLVMSNSSVFTENDGIVNLADFTTLDEMDGANYVEPKILANQTVVKDDPNDRTEFSADPVTWTALGDGTRQVRGIVLYKHIDGTDANDEWLASLQFTTDQSPGGSDFMITPNSEGLIQLRSITT